MGTPRRGIALVMTLVVIMLLMAFLAEFTFTTGLELRGVQGFQNQFSARALARSALRAVQLGLLEDEVLFISAVHQLNQLLQVTAVPWEDGLLVALTVEPLDSRFNLNRLSQLQPDSPKDRLYHEIFQNLLERSIPVGQGPRGIAEPLAPDRLSTLYAALFDWVDQDSTPYTTIPGTRGSETYFGRKPEYDVKNAKLDRLEEIRAVAGVAESGLAWEDWRKHFTVMEGNADSLYPGRINPNIATTEEIIAFLRSRRVEIEVDDASVIDIVNDLNEFADKAEEIAGALAPAEGLLRQLSMSDIRAILDSVGVQKNQAHQVFTTIDEYFLIAVTTEVDTVRASLEAIVHTPRRLDRTASQANIISLRIQ